MPGRPAALWLAESHSGHEAHITRRCHGNIAEMGRGKKWEKPNMVALILMARRWMGFTGHAWVLTLRVLCLYKNLNSTFINSKISQNKQITLSKNPDISCLNAEIDIYRRLGLTGTDSPLALIWHSDNANSFQLQYFSWCWLSSGIRASVVDNIAACLLVERLIATLQIKIVNDLELGSDEKRVMTRPTQKILTLK